MIYDFTTCSFSVFGTFPRKRTPLVFVLICISHFTLTDPPQKVLTLEFKWAVLQPGSLLLHIFFCYVLYHVREPKQVWCKATQTALINLGNSLASYSFGVHLILFSPHSNYQNLLSLSLSRAFQIPKTKLWKDFDERAFVPKETRLKGISWKLINFGYFKWVTSIFARPVLMVGLPEAAGTGLLRDREK
jgi:hypothetical protein